jgi:DNA-binding MarR family transcriptional regulator
VPPPTGILTFRLPAGPNSGAWTFAACHGISIATSADDSASEQRHKIPMADLKSSPNPLFLREEELRQGIELLFYAYRDFTADPDAILERYGFGRAHHRVLHFVGRNPGITIAQLLAILRITKQSLSRVLGVLLEDGYVEQRQGLRDRRQRQLFLTEKGQALEEELRQVQQARVARAYREAGAEAVAGYRQVLAGLIDEEDRERILKTILRDGSSRR